ncbi:uncharacterized protein LOC131231634 [Magnolia sinica]|uniref:uncharacterized protein LOC131231634 n=1 Tax=Magnolia sinica TaxID=86752 RepID=UPI0026596151|nr:uncharacterized protein LOC131231634 [Magnolia sinica]
MEYRSPKLKEGETSICLQIIEQWHLPTKFSEPQREIPDTMEKTDSNTNSGGSSVRQADQAPETKLTLFALQLAILEKTASGLGTLGFIWATVVLLGGFAITLDKKDFWFITIILLIEGTRIFSRSHELEWQHQATWSLTDAGKFSFRALKSSSNFLIRTLKTLFPPFSIIRPETNNSREVTDNTNINISRNQDRQNPATRTWVTQEVPLLPHTGWVFLTKNISKFLYCLQLLSASACVSLSLIRLIQQDYGDLSKGDSDKRNRKSALNIFYALALAEALLFLLEKAYWEWKVSYGKLLHKVNNECEFGNSGLVSIKRFFYDAYSRCVNGSIFDGLKMDLVSFAVELLASNSNDEQLTGMRILRKFAASKQYSNSTLRKIGTSVPMIERLVEMLNWKNPTEEEIRKSAAEILSKLAGKKQNSLRVAGIPGAMESISSLLYTGRSSSCAADEILQKNIIADHENYEFSAFNLLGLLILKKLAHDHDNCGKIGNTRGLLPKIIDFTHADVRLLRDNFIAESQITLVKRSLQLVKMLASTSGTTGEILRHEISEIVFTVSNIREILQYGENYAVLQKLGIEIITSLALDADTKERIGSTGGILKELLCIFFRQGLLENQDKVRVAAGEALAMLALESERNCKRILRLEAVEKLVGALNNPVLRVNSARILRNLCAYNGDDCYFQLKEVATATPTVLKATMSEEKKLQEVAVGLAAQIFRFMDAHELSIAFYQSGINETELVTELVLILKKHQYPSTKVPRIRRFVIELAICMMKAKEKNIQIFKDLGMEKELENVAGTTSELECFIVFSGSVGLSRHRTTVYSLVDTALQLLTNGHDQASQH